MNPGTRMYPLSVSTTAYTDGIFQFPNLAHEPLVGLNEVLDRAASLRTDPQALAFSEENLFGTAIAAIDESGRYHGIWRSEVMFRSAQAALDHAEDLLGSEIFPLICDDGGLWD